MKSKTLPEKRSQNKVLLNLNSIPYKIHLEDIILRCLRIHLSYLFHLLIVFILFFSIVSARTQVVDLQDGDLIFHTSKSRQSKAIQLATHSPISHMGLIFHLKGEAFVLEAVQPVKLTKIDEWIQRGVDGKYTVKRILNADSILHQEARNQLLALGLSFIGKDYDKYFEWSDDRLYCSELVYKVFKQTLNLEIGELQELKDFDLSDPYVQQMMLERFGKQIPYSEPVISPASMYDSHLLVTVYQN